MTPVDSKFHIKIGDLGFVIARSERLNRYLYNREEAPLFVNKFSSGDPNYRDATFFPHWVQLDWLNGFNQEYFDDSSKFYRSDALDTTDLTKLQLEEQFSSAGQVASGVNMNCIGVLPGTQNWANDNYGYRMQLTISAPASQNLVAGTTVKTTIDTAALQTATKLQADRDDWKIYYFNGASWVVLVRDYKTTAETWFALQADILAGQTSTVYYAYYGYAAETVNSQPSTEADWRSIYGQPADDTNVKLLALFEETSGTINDRSANTANTGTTSGSPTYNASGVQGSSLQFDGADDVVDFGNDSSLQITGAITIDFWIYPLATPGTQLTIGQKSDFSTSRAWQIEYTTASKIMFRVSNNGTDYQEVTAATALTLNAWNHVACVYSPSTYLKIFLNGAENWSVTTSIPASMYNSSQNVKFGGRTTAFTNMRLDGLRISNTARTSFSLGLPTSSLPITGAAGSEVAKAAAASTGGGQVFAGCSNGKIYKWDGSSTWTEAYDTTNTSVNCVSVCTFSNTTYLYFGTGSPSSSVDGTAKIYRTSDGTTFALAATLSGGVTSAVMSLAFYKDVIYAGASPMARIYSSTDGTTFALSKDINEPGNPGWPYAMAVYNGSLIVAGGHPEKFNTSNTQGFLWAYDSFSWTDIGQANFAFTVIKSLYVFDSQLYIGTIQKRLYTYNTASIDKLFEFPWEVSINSMVSYKDKLVIAVGPTATSGTTGYEALFIFDRNGIHDAFSNTATSYNAVAVVNNILLAGTSNNGYVYKTVSGNYVSTGNLQSSYFEASLPSIDKLLREVTIQYDALPVGCSIAVDYKVLEADSWTNLGTASTSGATSSTFTFGVAVYAKKISLRYTLATTDSTKTPTLRKVITKYVLYPDFKYVWKITLACADEMIWLDGTRPIGLLNAAVTAGDTTITLTTTAGFPNPNGSTMYATVINSSGTEDTFSYTGKSATQLTGVPATGSYALLAHTSAEIGVSKVEINGRNLHRALLDLKSTKKFYTFTDIDSNTYTALFHSFSSDSWVVDLASFGGIENDVPITLLEV